MRWRSRKEEERPGRSVFTPPEPSSTGMFVVIGLVLLAGWIALENYPRLKDRRPPLAAMPASRAPVAPPPEPSREVWVRPPIVAQDGSTFVTKCVVAGRVTFSDAPCEPGAQASTVVVRSTNIAEAPRVAPPPGPAAAWAPPEAAMQVGNPPVVEAPDSNVLRQQECAGLDREIPGIDAQARQPQSAAMQDWLASRRKAARDRQYALRC